MIIGVNGNVFSAQIAAVAKIAESADTQAYCDSMLRLRDNPACLFCIEFSRPAVSKYRNRPDFAVQFAQIQFDPG